LSFNHYYSKGFLPQLFSSFCLGSRTEAYWAETKRHPFWPRLLPEANHLCRWNAAATTIFFHAFAPCSSNANFHHLFPSPWQPPPLSEANFSATTVSSSSPQCTTSLQQLLQQKHRDPPPAANRNTDPQPARNANAHPDADHHHHATVNDAPDVESSATANEGSATVNEGSEPPLLQNHHLRTYQSSNEFVPPEPPLLHLEHRRHHHRAWNSHAGGRREKVLLLRGARGRRKELGLANLVP